MTVAGRIGAADADTLPGMDWGTVRGGRMTAEARAHMTTLREAGRLDDSHRMLVALIDSLAVAADMSLGRIAGVQAQRQLLDAMDRLPTLTDETTSDEWAQVLRALQAPEVTD